MEWLQHISDAVAYIESHLDDDISYGKAAEFACCSTQYFQRIFSYVAGISLSEYIRRRRMTQAAFDMQASGCKVLEAAAKYRYASPTSFNRAFHSVHGISPAAARQPGQVLNAYFPISFSVTATGGCALPYTVEKKPPMRIIGERIRLTGDIAKDQQMVPQFWDLTQKSDGFTAISQLAGEHPKGLLGVTVYHPNKEIDYYIAAASSKPAPNGMHVVTIPSATWVIFKCNGTYKESVQAAFSRFSTEWLPFSGYLHAMLPDIEVYPPNTGQIAENHSEVWIAVKNKL